MYNISICHKRISQNLDDIVRIDLSILALLSAYQEYLVTFKLMTSQVQRA